MRPKYHKFTYNILIFIKLKAIHKHIKFQVDYKKQSKLASVLRYT